MKKISMLVVFALTMAARADYWMTFCKTPDGRQYSQVGYVKPDDDGFVTVKAGTACSRPRRNGRDLLFSYEQHAQSPWTAMGGHGAARMGFDYFIEALIFFNGLARGFNIPLRAMRMGYEYAVIIPSSHSSIGIFISFDS